MRHRSCNLVGTEFGRIEVYIASVELCIGRRRYQVRIDFDIPSSLVIYRMMHASETLFHMQIGKKEFPIHHRKPQMYHKDVRINKIMWMDVRLTGHLAKIKTRMTHTYPSNLPAG